MKVCFVCQEYPPTLRGGGIGTQTFLEAHGLARRGHTVHVIANSADGSPHTAREQEVVVHRIPHPARETSFSEPSVHWMGYSWAVAEKIHRLSGEIEFDVIQFPDFGAEGFIYQLNAGANRRPQVAVGLHGPLAMFAQTVGWPPVAGDFYRFGTLMEETVVRKADLLLAYSRNIAKFWAARCSIALEDILVIHTAVDPFVFRPREAREAGRPTVLFVGRIDADKGVFAVVEAVRRLQPAHPDILLRIAGSGEEEATKQLREQISLGASRNFEFLGFVPHDQLPECYSECDVFASPAIHEGGVATVYLEALACGKPVIACNTGGAPEAVIHGETGLLVSPGDIEALAQALDRLFTDAELTTRLGRNGRKLILERFSVDRHVERMEAAYKRLLEFPT